MSTTDSLLPVFVNTVIGSFNDAKNYFEFELFGMNSFASTLTYFMFSLIKKFIVYFGDLNVFHWLIISAVVWLLIHGVYLKCMKLLLHRVGVDVAGQKCLSDTIWHLCFTAISVPVLASCVGASLTDVISLTGCTGWVDRLDYQLSKCKIHEDMTVPGVRTVYVLHSSFFIHDFIHTWRSKGFKNVDFLEKQVFLTVFVLTYYSKCPLLGLSVLFLLHQSTLVKLVSKLCCQLSNFTRSATLRYSAKLLCGYCLLLWSGLFLYTLPVFLLANKTIDSDMMKAELKVLIAMDFLLWVFLTISLFNSMLSRILLSVIQPSKDHPRMLEYYLFGSDCKSLVFRYASSQQPLMKDAVSEDSFQESNAKRSARALIQVVRCSVILKRKLRRLREEKERRKISEVSN